MPTKSLKNPDDLAKLPVWAQTEVEGLLREVHRLHGLVDELLANGPKDSDTFVSGRHMEPDRPLGRHVTINFGVKNYPLAKGGEITGHILDARWDAETETLHVSSCQGTVQITPWATNCFKVSIAPR